MKTFSIKESFGRAWEIWKGHKKVLTLITLFVFIVSCIPSPAGPSLSKTVFDFLIFVASSFLWMGYTKLMLLLERGEKVEFWDIFDHAKYFWRYFFASFFYTLIAGIGLVLLIIPGVYFAIKYCFVLTLIVDKDLKIGEAFTQSGKLTDGVKWRLLGLSGMIVLVGILGVLALGVGLLVATPVIMLASMVVYRKLSSAQHSHIVA